MSKEIPKWLELLEDFEDAVRQHAWLGGGPPVGFQDVKDEYARSKEAITEFMKGK